MSTPLNTFSDTLRGAEYVAGPSEVRWRQSCFDDVSTIQTKVGTWHLPDMPTKAAYRRIGSVATMGLGSSRRAMA